MVSRAKLIDSHVKLQVCEATDSNPFARGVQIIRIPRKSRRPSENAEATAGQADNTLTWERAAQLVGDVLIVVNTCCEHLL